MTTLNIVLSPHNTQRVHEALICLSKFSEFVSLEARRNQLIFSALNSTKSTYGAIRLNSKRYFLTYSFISSPSQSNSQNSNSDEARFTCRLQVRALLAVFRQRYLDSKDKDTAIEKCEVRIDETADAQVGGECRIEVRLHCRHGVLKTYKLAYEDVDVMHALFDRDLAHNRWRISSSLLKIYMEHFGPRAEQLDISANNENARAAFTSFTEKLIDGKEILKQPLQTSVALDIADFDEFTVDDTVHIAVSLKDFKAITTHAETMQLVISAYYSNPGRPLQLSYASDGLEAEFTLMTLADTRPTPGTQGFSRAVAATVPAPRPHQSRQQSAMPTQQHQREPTPSQVLAKPEEEADPGGESLYDIPPPREPPPLSSKTTRSQSNSQSQSQSQSQSLPRPVSGMLPPPIPQAQSRAMSEMPPPPVPQLAPVLTPPSPPLPPMTQRPQDAKLFLSFPEEDDDDLMSALEEADDMVLNWDETADPLGGMARHGDGPVEEVDMEEDDEEGVGPTQQTTVVMGLFD